MLSRKAYLNYIGTYLPTLPSRSITGFEHIVLKPQNEPQNGEAGNM